MLGTWRCHDDYQKFVSNQLNRYADDPEPLLEYYNIICKLWIFDLDPLEHIIAPFYSHTGRPAEKQPELFRTFVLMQHLDIPVNLWLEKLKHNHVLRTACGYSRNNLPSISTFYLFVDRITGTNMGSCFKKFVCKPKKKLKQGEKLPPKHPGITGKLKDQMLKGRRYNDPVADILNEILALSVRRSLQLGLLSPCLNVSGDGTCVPTGASPYGKKTCGCKNNGIHNCECSRKFSDPTATWGWDSHNTKYFYGYTGYFISAYDKTHKTDIPLYLRLVDAKRHDSVSAIVSLSEFRDLYPELNINSFISDSASDNYATYELLNEWDIKAVIALGKSNNGNNKYPVPVINKDGTPICPAGHKMIYHSFNKDRCRNKWRCPGILAKVERCEACDACSPSSYGRVVYTKPEWDLRLFCKIPRGSEQWKKIMKERTAAERINDRILNDYGVEHSHRRGKKRIFFDIMIAAVNIHLDAQLKIITAHGFDFLREVA